MNITIIVEEKSGDTTSNQLYKTPEAVDLSEYRSSITGILLWHQQMSLVATNVSLDESFGDIVGFSENYITD